ncbi:Di-copper centre-containing protein [Conidiobolus coronatus NRRL 28638]|uniref:Di-copper centre-containing protein n=1 Tax=Conidiobolus coronatus (strain ATCC 28846 / CBS 209.66 / NRRL 28638) TaxID=796925 RepID=A0A137P2U0_CONC2|nr:Di-copper centre-containing protein [Conidiobolus coronatus NRRL 28638]|eukprot:KXN69347.1 Di-copper centre-containing protein [Conidiobolus coronatus NRRL 28638]
MNLTKLISLAVLVVNTVAQSCNGQYRERIEFERASESDRTRFINAFSTWMQKKDGRLTLASISKLHNENSRRIHGTGFFLAWHRILIYQVETELLKIDPSVKFLFWDWTRNSQAPDKSAVLQSKYFCGNGSGRDSCLAGCKFAMQVDYPSRHCLRRNFRGTGGTLNAFSNRATVEMALTENNGYSTFNRVMETRIHSTPHVQIGGQTGDMSFMYSTNDVAFFLHHCFVDMLWAEWQTRLGSSGLTYGGSVSLTDRLPGFDATARDALDNDAKPLCIKYPRWTAVLPKTSSSIASLAQTRSSKKQKNKPKTHRDINKFKKKYTTLRAIRVHEVAIAVLNGTIEGKKVNSDDRTETHVLRTPDPIDDEWIKMNNLDIEEFRAEEEYQAAIIEAINIMDDYDPTAGINDINGFNSAMAVKDPDDDDKFKMKMMMV